MVKYSFNGTNETKAAKAKGSHLRIHYKHCREIAQAIKGRTLKNAHEYLASVLEFKDAIPFTKYTGGIGRHSVAKKYAVPGDKVGWPIKAVKVFKDLLVNVQSNAESKNLDFDKLFIKHAEANQAPKMRRRTYRAHGRINAYMSSPAHIEVVVEEKNEEIAKEKEDTYKPSKKQIARSRAIKVGGGAN